jgi:hypothetical protein
VKSFDGSGDDIVAAVKAANGDISFRRLNYQAVNSSCECQLQTRFFNFQSPFNLKRLLYLDLWMSEVLSETVDIEAFFRPDGFPLFVPMEVFRYTRPSDGKPHSLDQVRLSAPKEVFSPVWKKKALSSGYAFQILIKWSGDLKLDRVRLVASVDGRENHTLGCISGGAFGVIEEDGSMVEEDYWSYEEALS